MDRQHEQYEYNQSDSDGAGRWCRNLIITDRWSLINAVLCIPRRALLHCFLSDTAAQHNSPVYLRG
ncbi:hypothetical protein J6590_091987, partial [Homalodisca vitripennis]